MGDIPEAAVEAAAKAAHDAYEANAAGVGYRTRPESRVQWDQLDSNHRELMVRANRAALTAAAPLMHAELRTENERLREALNQTEHVVELTESGWSVEHLAECRRIPNGMTKCAVHEALAVFSDELLDDHGYGRFRLVGWDDDYPMLALVADSEEVHPILASELRPKSGTHFVYGVDS